MIAGDRLILVVDDQHGVRCLIEEVFYGSGYRVITAANGQEAVELVAAQRPDAVLLDMKMPVMDGLEALRIIKQGKHPSVVVIMMTAVGDDERMNEAFSAGAHTCIAKPFDVFALRELVARVLW